VSLLTDLRYAARTLLRDRGQSAVIVISLTMGIAANAVMVGVVDQLLVQPPPGIVDAGAVRVVYFGASASRSQTASSYPRIAALRDHVGAFASASAIHRARVTVGLGLDAGQADAELVNASYFPLLGQTPAAGRFFTSTEDRVPDADPVIVLSHAFWTRQFNRDPGAIGRHLLVEGKPLAIIGVASRGFSGTERQPVDFWAPPGALGRELFGDDWMTTENRYRFSLVVRLAAGVSDERANAEASAAYRSTLDRSPANDAPQVFGARLNGLANPRGLEPQARVGLWLLGVAIVVLLVACANVANLLLGRTISRGREIAIRVAIGASRWRLLRQLLTEAAALSAIAATTAIALTYVGARLVQQLLLPGFVWNHGVVDERVLAITLVLGTLTTMVAGLAPAVHALSDDVMPGLRTAPRVRRGRVGVLRSGLLATQVGMSVVLLVGAGLFLRSLAAVRAHDVGLDLDRVIEATLPSTLPREESDRLHALALERVRTIPGVESGALSGGSARLSSSLITTVTPEGSRGRDDDRSLDAFFVVTVPYFRTLGARIERGRDFSVGDDQATARVAIINRAGAERFWPGEDPIGKCVSFSISFNRSTCSEIVGVVENTLLHHRLRIENAQLFVLRSHPGSEKRRLSTLVLRTAGDASAFVPSVRAALQTLTPGMRYVEVNTLEAMVAPQLQPWRLGTSMFFIFGAVALLIAAVGVYSTMAFAVWQRRQEIGIRMALGAAPFDAAMRVARSAGVTIVIGLAAGLVAAALAGRFLVDLLFETSPRDPLVLVVVAAVLAVTGLAASIVPARRAARVDPLLVLKAE
jgi:predicted permease